MRVNTNRSPRLPITIRADAAITGIAVANTSSTATNRWRTIDRDCVTPYAASKPCVKVTINPDAAHSESTVAKISRYTGRCPLSVKLWRTISSVPGGTASKISDGRILETAVAVERTRMRVTVATAGIKGSVAG